MSCPECAAEQRAKSAEQGLYDVYDALGFDKDGARTPRELFGPMTNGTPAEIVVEAAKEFREHSEREADEAEQRAEQAEAELRDVWRTDIPSLKDQRDALAAVVEKVLSHDPLHGADSGLHCGGMAPCIRDILSTAPAEALREHDAALIEGLADKWEALVQKEKPPVRGSMWLYAQARQQREEQSNDGS